MAPNKNGVRDEILAVLRTPKGLKETTLQLITTITIVASKIELRKYIAVYTNSTNVNGLGIVGLRLHRREAHLIDDDDR